ncbi:SGNH hydrolase domain-containing protein [Micromonospora sp. CA-244673]|uniref:SGNH hydrolase domain-containing protein n=1 Tax=Micromonospora sp. CA-244673 TaxID=3239958 RepID=UPI003D9347F7
MPSGKALARRFAVLLGAIAIGCAAAVPGAAAVPTYARNEPAVAVATPATVFLEARYVGYLRNTATGALVHPEPVVVVRRCSGAVVNPDGYVVTTTVCVQPSREVLLVNALYRLGRSLVQRSELPAERLDGYVAGLQGSSAFTGARRGSAPTLRLTGQFGVATSGDAAVPAVAGAVTKALPAVDGNVALVKLRRGDLPAVELAPAPDLRAGSSLDILGYALGEGTGDSGTWTVRNRTVEVIGRTGTNRTGVSGQIGPDSRGGPVVDAEGRLVALLDTDTAAEGEPIRDLIVTANLNRLLTQSGVDNRLSGTDRAFRSALAVYFAGHYSQAITRFDDVLTQDPGHAAARAYRQRAQERLRLDGDLTENAADWWSYLLSAAGGALVIGAVTLGQRALRRRLRPAPVGRPDPDAGPAEVGPPGPAPLATTAAPAPPSPEDTLVLTVPAAGRKYAPAPSSPEDTAAPASADVPSATDDTLVLNLPEAGPGTPTAERADGGTPATPTDAGPGTPRERPRSAFRPDIEGLRALAVLLVVLWHAGVPFISGGFVGVDVFFVISGYLITTGMAAEVAARGRLSLGRFWARRAKRLLPSSALVLLAALLLTYLLLPDIRWRDTAGDVVSSAVYLINWRLADQAVDYLAAGQAPSIVQHYWSLAVEEQFYLVWPVLLVGVAWLARRGRTPDSRFRALAFGAVAVVGAASFAWSVLLVESDPGRAYFVTTTRMWELAVGALLALAPTRRLTGAVAAAAGWLGVAAIAASAVVLSTSTPFPGTMALPATVGAALVIAAGAARRWGPVALLRLPPMQFLGGISYTLYLWHWPLLVVLTARMPDAEPPAVVATVALAVVLAYLTSRLVERPVWHSRRLAVRPRVALSVGAACTVLSVCAGLAFQTAATAPAAPPVGAGGRDAPGAAVLTAGGAAGAGVPVDHAPSVVPDPSAARNDLPSVYADRCHAGPTERAVLRCVYGPPEATVTIAVVGDSHAAQWVPTLRAIAERRNWRLLTYTKSSCPAVDVEVVADGQRPIDTCAAWNRDLPGRLAADRPNLVVTSSYNYSAYRDGRALKGPEGRAALVDGMRRTWRSLARIAPVVVLRDTPAPRLDVAECVSAHREELTRCAVPRDEALAGIGPLQVDAAQGLTGVRLVDLNDAICPADRCAAVIGGVLVYRDTNHLTATYARTLAARLDEQLQMVMG